MIYFVPGWNSTAIGESPRRGDRGVSRIGIAARLSESTARTIIEKAAELADRSGQTNFKQYFADLVQRKDRVMTVEKGLHQEEGSIVDADSHITLRAGFLNKDDTVTTTTFAAYHLYIQMIDPPPGKNSYSLAPLRLSVRHGRNSFELKLDSLGTFPSP